MYLLSIFSFLHTEICFLKIDIFFHYSIFMVPFKIPKFTKSYLPYGSLYCVFQAQFYRAKLVHIFPLSVSIIHLQVRYTHICHKGIYIIDTSLHNKRQTKLHIYILLFDFRVFSVLSVRNYLCPAPAAAEATIPAKAYNRRICTNTFTYICTYVYGRAQKSISQCFVVSFSLVVY